MSYTYKSYQAAVWLITRSSRMAGGYVLFDGDLNGGAWYPDHVDVIDEREIRIDLGPSMLLASAAAVILDRAIINAGITHKDEPDCVLVILSDGETYEKDISEWNAVPCLNEVVKIGKTKRRVQDVCYLHDGSVRVRLTNISNYPSPEDLVADGWVLAR